MTPIVAQGRYGTVTFDGTFVTITRTKTGVRLTGSGEKRFHIRNVTAVNFKSASLFSQGRIEFTVPGGQERRGRQGSRTQVAGRDENALIFVKKHSAKFAELKDAVYAAQAEIL